MMKKTKVLSFLLIVALALNMNFTILSVNAASNVFNYEFIDDANKTFVEGVTKEAVKSAFDAEINRLQTEEGWDFSKVSVSNHPASNQWPSSLAGSAIIAAHLISTEYSSGNAWGSGYIMMIYNPHHNKVYTVKDGAMSRYSGALDGWATNAQNYGYPLGNQFTAGGNTYQNFTFGYMTITGSYASFTAGKKMQQDGTEAVLTKDDYAENGVYPIYNAPGSSLENYVSEYKSAINSVDVDMPLSAFRMDWGNLWMQILTGSNFSTASIWGQSNVGLIVYNTVNHKMVIVKDEFVSAYTMNPSQYGYPAENDFQAGGIRYQNFELGYMKVENAELTFKPSYRVNQAGEEYQLFTSNDIGVLNDGTELSGITPEEVRAAIQSRYTQDMGLPTTYVSFHTGTNVLYQRFLSDDGKTSFIFVYGADNAVVMGSDVWEKFEKPEGYNWAGFDLLGLPASDAFAKGDSKIQNFSKGYLEITGDKTKVVVGANIDAADNITILDFSNSIFFNSAISKLPASWNVTPEELVNKFKAKYLELKNSGFIAGAPGNEGIKTWTEYEQDENNEFADGRGMLILALQSGGSTAKPWYDVTMYMVYNPVDGNIYLIKDDIMNGIAVFRSQLGAPVGEAFTYKGLTIQNFQKGYVAVTAAGSATYKDNLNFSLEKGKEVNLDGSDIQIPTESPAPNEEANGCGGCNSYGAGYGAAIFIFVSAAYMVLRRGKNEKL
jgi:hypothetical protein